MQGRLLIYVLGLLIMMGANAQKITVKGGFIEDSLKIGEDIHYWVSAEYPDHLELIFPDTTYNFSPFEFSGKEYFPSIIKTDRAFDSAVYTLQSYEIDPIQSLSIPVFILKPTGDSTRIDAGLDSIFFKQLLEVVTDTTSLKTNLAYQNVPTQFNFPLLWIILGVLMVLTLATYLIFGKKIRKTIRLRKLKKDFIAFSEHLTMDIRSLKEAPNQKIAEHALTEWKNFLERLEQRPFSKLTTKEIMALEYTGELNGTLKNIDRCVYGGRSSDELYKDFQAIEDFTQHRYSVITDQIKNS
ncbi:hypothetical protein [Marinoscillum sp. 108]|uniref:hypothetical protein n=1 Tax=Marinoscillum sp. 108 TaxID=2653151 RepID=UPI0012F316F2|nr:hypothetical protein [Marinoscillum sp. 108]VXD12993.1 conserved hypothetical protein [Marinoscillum sp. 108]